MSFIRSQDELEWQHEHHDETRVPGIIAACVATGIASVIIMALRFLSRRLLRDRLCLEASDWFILVAWVFFATTNICWAVGTRFGIGRHAAFDIYITVICAIEDGVWGIELAIVGEAAYVLAIAFIKFSVLALYSKMFPLQKLRYYYWGVAVVVAGWAMSGSVVAIFQCTSIDYVWRPDARQFCVNFSLRNLVSGVINIVTSIFIVAMAIPSVRSQKVTGQEKWLTLFTFAIGSRVLINGVLIHRSACIISIVRLPYSIKVGTSDETWDAAPTVIVSVFEITVGMLAVSIPTYQPLYKHVFGPRICSNNNNTRACCYKETLHIGLYGKGAQNDVKVTSPGIHMGSDQGGINVTNHIELIRHTNKSGLWVRVTDEDEEGLCKSTEEAQAKCP
ncbi:hypothetical protein EKO27_g1195 [Xylaria grammica]|uniref:Rhodopsin domain-containing protein n=1 Tax=Xylaria grammica TaxID=363999 RepID=A0A439DHN0_9PEZI|nr:hypothetical protein EKO27_g1195 [Xylaria grammica]